MIQKAPEVSVVVPVFNSEVHLREALNSIMKQTFRNFDVIVVDDGSETDACERIVVEAQKESPGKIRYLRQENRGPASARNRGVAGSDGELVAFLDSDDVYAPGKLMLQIEMMRGLPQDYAFVSGGYERYADGTRRDALVVLPALIDGEIYPALLDRSGPIPWPPAAHLFRRVALATVGGYDCALRYGEDKELLIRLARTFKGRMHRDVVFSKRLHGSSASLRIDQARLLADVSYLVRSLEAADPQLPDRVLKRMHQEALLAAATLALGQHGNHARFAGLVKEALRHDGLAAGWSNWKGVLSEYAAMMARRLRGSWTHH